jgi:phage FluMu gp28-like protein
MLRSAKPPNQPRLKFFRPSQLALIANEERDIVVEWARGNGKTFVIAAKITRHTFKAEADGRVETWLIASATRDQAREAIDMVAKWCKVFFALGKEIGIIEEEVKTPDGKEIFTRYLIRIGSQRIMAQAASPAAARGYTANIWWDEAAHHPDGKEMYEALRHCTRGIFKMIVSGTPWGDRDNMFYQLVHSDKIYKGKPLWSKSIVDIVQAVAEGRLYDINREKEQSDPDKWAREMMLQWIDGVTQWLGQGLIRLARSAQCSIDGSKAKFNNLTTLKPRFFLGNDIGLRGDRWVAWVLQRDGRFLRTVEVIALQGADFEEQERVIAALFTKYKFEGMAIDQGGMGEESTEKYIKKYGSTRVEGVIFNGNNKGAMALQTKRGLESGMILLPPMPSEQKAAAVIERIEEDLRSIVRCVSASGNVRFTADRRDGGHADHYSALTLAVYKAMGAGEELRQPKASGSRQKQRSIDYAGY